MHIPRAHLITLIIITCDPSIHFVPDLVYADYKDNIFTDSGAFSVSTNKSNRSAKIRYPSNSVIYGITIYEKLLATALDNIIVVYNISSSVKIEDVHRVQLPKSIRKKLLEFKFINQEMLFYCDTLTCRLCVLTSPEKPFTEYLLTLNGRNVEELLYATAVKDSSQNVNIRIVTKHANQAAILRFPPYHAVNGADKLPSVQSAEDIRIIDKHGLATAFNRLGYTYFVGSARRPYEPYINARIEELIVMSVRITRVCDEDRTEKLESRIDMALTCGNFSLQTDVVSLAAEYYVYSDELIVVFQTAEKNENVACKYSMDLVDNAFNQVWINCQNISSKSSIKECQKIKNSKELPPYCFIFSRRADGHAMRTCSRFGGSYIKEPLNNCDLRSFPSFAYRYGWLEQFHAFAGQLIAVLPGSGEDILSVKRFHEDGALFTVHSDGILNRVSDQTNQVASSLLWSLQLQQAQYIEQSRTPQYRIATDLSRNRIYLVHDNELSYAELTCSYFYDSCDSLERSNWSDPLQCLWCAMKNGSGYAFSRSKGTCPSYAVENLCTPFIEHVNVPSSSFSNHTSVEVYGRKFDRFQDIAAKVCNRDCIISNFGATKLSCIVNISNGAPEDCNFYLEGELNSFGRFSITFELPKKRGSHITNTILASTHSHSKQSRAIAAIFAVIVLAFLILLILCLLRQFHKRQRNRLKQCGTSDSQIALDTSHATFVGNNPFTGLIRKGNDIKAFNPYENLFMEIDSKLQIPLKNLELGDEIGKVGTYHDVECIRLSIRIVEFQFDGCLLNRLKNSRYHHVMRQCWMEDPTCRPTFLELTEMMEDVVRQLRRGVSGGALLDSHYERVSARSVTTPLTTNSGASNGTTIITGL
uniref:Receptor protein-tyrosine kinase n=1 Tax=Elaeophora elaphi TaxID=1147741 RepID=A0A0R3RVJ8_9BILA